ncbi:MAG: type II toxin-antitoxin system VapC family toxin [Alphaproteobacteria bacterium]|nr:type II toxin-antitoxin system VapC family toxin [Alphaproteobacteria bacterium]
MYLIDTNVISASAPGRSAPPGLGDWMDQNASLLFLSSVTIAEVTEGIAKARREGSTRKADDLAAWLGAVLHLYPDRVLPFDASVAETLGGLSDHARVIGRSPGLADLIIAATAKHHGLTILTRNVRHFAPLTVAVHDPFAGLPS